MTAMRQDEAWHWVQVEGGGYSIRDENRLLVAIIPSPDRDAAKGIALVPEMVALTAGLVNAWNTLTGNDPDGEVNGGDAVEELKALVVDAEKILKGLAE